MSLNYSEREAAHAGIQEQYNKAQCINNDTCMLQLISFVEHDLILTQQVLSFQVNETKKALNSIKQYAYDTNFLEYGPPFR